jgi:hypothetical protein
MIKHTHTYTEAIYRDAQHTKTIIQLGPEIR